MFEHRRRHRLGDRRGARLRRAAAGGQSRAPLRRGHPARHVQPAPRGADRPDQPERIRAAEQHRARAGEDRNLQLAAVRGRRAGLRIRLHARRSAHAGAVGRRSSATSPTARRSSSTSSCASGESKWLRMSGLVLLLPHGYEGQGPEHSSARLERYLQLCAEGNMAVAQHHHARQLLPRAAPPVEAQLPQAAGADDAEKSLLRHKLAVSTARRVRPAMPGSAPCCPEIDPIAPAAEVRRVVLCTGKVYYDLLAERREQGDQRHRHRAPRAALSVP